MHLLQQRIWSKKNNVQNLLGGAGTHGSIKSYQYPVTKQTLQDAAEKVLAEGGKIQRDTIPHYKIDVTDGKNDTLWDNYYNDTVHYVTIFITNDGKPYQYTFHYTGDSQYWKETNTSELSIVYAWNEKDQGGSEGDGGVTNRLPDLKNDLTSLFEQRFIVKIDKVLGVKHTENWELPAPLYSLFLIGGYSSPTTLDANSYFPVLDTFQK